MADATRDAPDRSAVKSTIEACGRNDVRTVESLLAEDPRLASWQDEATGASPLMAAAAGGHADLVDALLERGAPWNAVDRNGRCAGNHAADAEKWDAVNRLVQFGTRAEMILGAAEREMREGVMRKLRRENATNRAPAHAPSTKPDFLSHELAYNDSGTALLDEDADAVMMAWERPLMRAHAEMLMENVRQSPVPNRVLNIGFGMGIIDTALQRHRPPPSLHVIVEAHPDVYAKMIRDGWGDKPNVKIYHGTWQDVLPRLIDEEHLQVDAIFYDTYAEHAMDMEDLHALIGTSTLLSKPHGIYSFFNGLAPDNIFFHGVACNVIKLQLGRLGLDSEFIQCRMQEPPSANDDAAWRGIRRKYWHDRDTYYLPRCTWNAEHIGRKTKSETKPQDGDDDGMEVEQTKRRRL